MEFEGLCQDSAQEIVCITRIMDVDKIVVI